MTTQLQLILIIVIICIMSNIMINILRHITKTGGVLICYSFRTPAADLNDSRQSGPSSEGLLPDSNFVQVIS